MMRRDDLKCASLAFALFVQALTLIAFLSFDYSAHGQAAVQLDLERTITLPNVSGRIDHLAVDVPRQRLFVAELGNGSVDRIDLSSGETRRIGGLKEPQGLAYGERPSLAGGQATNELAAFAMSLTTFRR